jgi:hypothetical protein
LVCFFAALAAAAVYDLAELVAGRRAALLTWIAVCLTVPFVPHSWLLFPEMPAALLVAWAALWLARPSAPSAWRWALRGAALAVLPWLHTKFAVFLALFSIAHALRLFAQVRGSARLRVAAAFLAPIAISGILWLYFFYAIYGVFDPQAPYGAHTRMYVLNRNIPHGLLGLLFDQKFGLLVYSPIYLLSFAGAWWLVRDRHSRWLGILLAGVAVAFTVTTARFYMFWGGSSAPARFLVPILPCLAPMMAAAFGRVRTPAARGVTGLWLGVSVAVAAIGVVPPHRLMLFSDPHGRARILDALQGGSPLSLVAPTFTDPDWASHVRELGVWLLAAALGIAAAVAVARASRRTAFQAAGVATLVFLCAAAVLTAHPSAAVREAAARNGAITMLGDVDRTRHAFDYARRRGVPSERLRDLCTVTLPMQAAAPEFSTPGVDLPAGEYDALVWFNGPLSPQGEIAVASPPRTVFGRAAGVLTNPTRIGFELPAQVDHLAVRTSDKAIAVAISSVRIVPVAVPSRNERDDVRARAIDSIQGREHAYVVYTDDRAYPEGGVFWTARTADTQVYVAPGGASRMTVTLSTGPMNGEVRLSTPGATRTVATRANERHQIAIDLPSGHHLIPLKVGSSVMFRPADVDPSSRDVRELGCRVLITLE